MKKLFTKNNALQATKRKQDTILWRVILKVSVPSIFLNGIKRQGNVSLDGPLGFDLVIKKMVI